MDQERTYVVIRTDTEIEDLYNRAKDYFHPDGDDVYAEGVFNTIEWLFDECVVDPFGG